ncbi:MAG: cytidylyltransferase domain-containing protein [Brevinematia bacterium]
MVLGIIQARINSDRFPMKVFAKFSDSTCLLERVIKQVKHSFLIDKVVVATNHISFASISSFVKENFEDVDVISGPDEDVLARFVSCIDIFDPKVIVRITADNPLTCPRYIDYAIDIHLSENADLTHFLGIPLGTGVEVVNAESLLRVSELTFDLYDREHVTPFFYNNREVFKVIEAPYEKGNFEYYRVTIDTLEDLEVVDKVLASLGYRMPVLVEDVVEIYEKVFTKI